MNQDALFFWLKDKFEGGEAKFWSVADLKAATDFYDVRSLLVKLYAWGYLDIEITDVRRYRVKKRFLSCEVVVKSPLSPNLTYAEFCKLFKEGD